MAVGVSFEELVGSSSRGQKARPESRIQSERNEWEKVVAGHASRKHVGEARRGHIGALEFT